MTTSSSAPGPCRGDTGADEAGAVAAAGPAPGVATVAADAGVDGWWLALTAEDFARQDEIIAVEQEAREAGRLPGIVPEEDELAAGFDPACAPPVCGGWVPGMPWPGERGPPPIPIRGSVRPPAPSWPCCSR